jgi:ribosome-associated protein
MPLFITDQITLADWEMTESFVRSSGPGGQNVNKVSTRSNCASRRRARPSLPDAVKRRLQAAGGAALDEGGGGGDPGSEERSQARNREIARERLAELVKRATVVPKRRRPTKPTRGSVERRIKAKKVRGEVKGLRGKVE